MQKHAEFQPSKALNTALKPFPTSYPGGITPDTLFDARTERIIGAQADKMVATGLFEQFERDDVANDLRVILAYEMANYDPARARYTFAATVLAKRGINEIIKRGNYLRDNPRPISLDRPVGGAAGETFAGPVSSEDYAAFWSGRAAGGCERLRKDVEALLASLDATDASICRMLMDGRSIRDIASRLGMTHAGVRYHIMKVIAPAARTRKVGGKMEADA